MANGSVESKDESSEWTGDASGQSLPNSRRPQSLASSGDNDDLFQAAAPFPPLPHNRPPSMAELQERAVQDSQNNNVDENSNDQHFDYYAAASGYSDQGALGYPAYHYQDNLYSSSNREGSAHPAFNSRETSRLSHSSRDGSSGLRWEASSQNSWRSSHLPSSSQQTSSLNLSREAAHSYQGGQTQACSDGSHNSHVTSRLSQPHRPAQEAVVSSCDQSVRPRVRKTSQHRRDEPDQAVPLRLRVAPRRDSFSSSSCCQHSGLTHRRNRSEGTTPANRYPPLPNHNCPLKDSDGPLPRLPGGRNGSYDQNSSMQWLPLPLALRGGQCSPHPTPALPPSERVTQEAQELLTTFTLDTLRNNRLEVPRCMQDVPSSSSPHLIRAGRELRLLADAFAGTTERRKVRLMAESVNLSCIEMSDFFQLCAELFYDGITRERIVALFTFVGDVAVHQVKIKGEELIHVLMKWSLRYLVEHVCRWVQEAGGWVAVLTSGAHFLYRCAVFAFCVCGSVAASLFIYKTLRNG